MGRARGTLAMVMLAAVLLCPSAARAQDSDAPKGALPHWLPTEAWVYEHWLPYDEQRLEQVLGVDRGAIFNHLRNDAVHDLAQLAQRRGLSPRQAARRLVEPRRGRTRSMPHAELVERAERTLTQGHLSQHILFHSLHQLTIPRAARHIFGTKTEEAFLALRRAELSPGQIGRLHGRTQAQMLARINRALRATARRGVRRGAVSARQAKILLDRQLRQVPRFLGQSRYNGPPRTGKGSRPLLPPNDFANNPSMTADGAVVVFDAYRATIPEAKTLGEIRVMRYDVAAGARQEVSHDRDVRSPRSAYNSVVSADGRLVVFEQALGNQTFGKRYGQMQVFGRAPGSEQPEDVSHRRVRGSRTAYNPSVSADGRFVAYEASDDGGRRGRSAYALEVRDRRDGSVQRLGAGGGYGSVFEPQLSGDGRSIVFTSTDGGSVVFMRRLATGRQTLVARDARDPAVSHDATIVAYAHGTSGRSVLSVRDLTTGVATRLTRIADGQAVDPSVSPDGRFVTFVLRRGRHAQAHLHDRATGRTVRLRPSGPGAASEPVVSGDGSKVAFTTTAQVGGKPAGTPGVVLADLTTGRHRLLSTHPAIKRGPGARRTAAAAARPGYCPLAV